MKLTKAFIIEINEEIREKLIEISKRALPNESTAILFGKKRIGKNGDGCVCYTVDYVEEFISSILSPVFFSIDEVTLYEKWINAQKKGLKLLSIFHSHPNFPNPSNTDKLYMKNIAKVYLDWIWIIFGNTSSEFKAFIWNKGKIKKVKINFV